MPDFKGIVAAILTPFDDQDNIDLGYMKDHIRFIEEAGVQGFVPSGTNGEAPSMTVAERKRIIEHCAKNKGSMFMVAGTGTTNVADTVELSKAAQAAGADAIMVLPPFFFPNAPQQGHIDYFKRVFDAVSIPIFLYNIPQCTGVWITDELVRALEHYPHLAGIKDSSCELDSTLHYIKTFPNLSIFVGSDHHVLTVLKAGGKGHISGMPNAMPQFNVDLYRAFSSGEDATGQQERLTRVREIMSDYIEFPLNKYLLTKRGFPFTHCRPPLVDMTDDEKARFEASMKEAGLWPF